MGVVRNRRLGVGGDSPRSLTGVPSLTLLECYWEAGFLPTSPQHHGAFLHCPGFPHLFCSLSQACFAEMFWEGLQQSHDGCHLGGKDGFFLVLPT